MENLSKDKNAFHYKARALERLNGNWSSAVFIFILMVLISGISGVGFPVALIVTGPLYLGFSIFFLKLIRGTPVKIELLFEGFRNFGTAFGTYLIVTLFVILWSLLLIVPGIIAAISYSMTFYIIADDPSIGVFDAVKKSKSMTYGHKKRLFNLYLSFLGWILLGILTLGIGFLWIVPYIKTSEAFFYEDLKQIFKQSSSEVH